jgi:hypothetical protein
MTLESIISLIDILLALRMHHDFHICKQIPRPRIIIHYDLLLDLATPFHAGQFRTSHGPRHLLLRLLLITRSSLSFRDIKILTLRMQSHRTIRLAHHRFINDANALI